jgi:hypothetical protein
MDNGSAPPHGEVSVSPPKYHDRLTCSVQTIEQALDLFHDQGNLFEIRSFVDKVATARWFIDHQHAADYVLALPDTTTAVYFTPNKIAEDTEQRVRSRKGRATADTEVTHRQWLLIDIDAIRPAGMSSTDEEKEQAKQVACDVYSRCVDLGFESPLVADSGNGWHICYPIYLPESPTIKQAIKSLLLALGVAHDSPHARVDRGVFNASRIWKLPGSVARKGVATPDRPHRLTDFASFQSVPTRAEIKAARGHNNAALSGEHTARFIAEAKRFAKAARAASTATEHATVDDSFAEPAGYVIDGSDKIEGRNNYLFTHGCDLTRAGSSADEVRQSLLLVNETRCVPPLDSGEVDGVARKSYATAKAGMEADAAKLKNIDRLLASFDRATESPTLPAPPPDRAWPTPPPPSAFIGPLGAFVEEVAPLTEGDPSAILLQALLLFGSRLGRTLHVRVGATYHYANNNLLVVGTTARGRKGVAASIAELLFRPMDGKADDTVTISSDPLHCMPSKGLSSGQGLINLLRNPTADDPGVLDKRLAILEPEFARVLAMSRMKDSTLSATIRDLWDSGTSQIMNKGTPVWSTGGHLTIMGSITPAELIKETTATDYENGLLNRFIFCASRRTKLLPMPDSLDPDHFDATRQMLRAYVANALTAGPRELHFDQAAKEWWCDALYAELERERFGIASSLLARASPHVRRLSLIFAASEASTTIRLSHLTAANELWKYAERSVAYVFGSSTGDKLADLILSHLLIAKDGLSSYGVYEALSKNYTEPQRTAALAVLVKQGLATCSVESPNGRACTVWRAV